MKYFTVAWLDSRTPIWMFLYNVRTQELFEERQIWDRVCLRNIQKFHNFDEIFYCGMARLKNLILNSCGLCRYGKAIKPKKVVRRSLFKNHLKSQSFNIQQSFLLWRGQIRAQIIRISTNDHMFKREIWAKFTEFTFLKLWNLRSETREIWKFQKMK